jgi:hypothetical protein
MVAGVAQLFMTTRSHIPATKVAATIAKSTIVDFSSSGIAVEVAWKPHVETPRRASKLWVFWN